MSFDNLSRNCCHRGCLELTSDQMLVLTLFDRLQSLHSNTIDIVRYRTTACVSLFLCISQSECFLIFPDTETTALVMSRDRPHLSFGLSLLSSEKTYDYPQQNWRFQSHYALRDYSGVYFIKLIPCTADEVS